MNKLDFSDYKIISIEGNTYKHLAIPKKMPITRCKRIINTCIRELNNKIKQKEYDEACDMLLICELKKHDIHDIEELTPSHIRFKYKSVNNKLLYKTIC